MKYMNIKTGYIFESDAEIKGGNWVELNSQPSVTKKEENTTEENTTEEDTTEEDTTEEDTTEENTAPKKRTARKTTRNK